MISIANATMLLVYILLIYASPVCSANEEKECLFAGCSCFDGQVVCPSAASPPLYMFPKRYSSFDTSSQKRPQQQHLKTNISYNISVFQLTHQPLVMMPDGRLAKLAIHHLNLSHNKIEKLSPFTFRDVQLVTQVDLRSALFLKTRSFFSRNTFF